MATVKFAHNTRELRYMFTAGEAVAAAWRHHPVLLIDAMPSAAVVILRQGR